MNPAPYLREKIFTLLNGNVTYLGDPIPVYENEGVNTERQIIIGDYSDDSRGSKDAFGATASQVIEVVSEQHDAVRKHVDAIGDLVNNILMPDPGSNTLSGADFLIVMKRPSINHITEGSGSGKRIVRLILRYNLLISHN